jgi:predicted aspartyl protease
MQKFACLLFLLLTGTTSVAMAGEFNSTVAMNAKGGTTFYVAGQITGIGPVDLMVDTGSGYMTINEEMLAALKLAGQVRFVTKMRGKLANGSILELPVYSIEAVRIGEACWLHDVEAAVFPGNTRPILGLNALQRAAPFIFSFEPPSLVLSYCDATESKGLAAALLVK